MKENVFQKGKANHFYNVNGWCVPTLQGAGALLGKAEMLLAQTLEWLMLSDLHARAHVAVAVHEEGERTRQVLAAWQVKDKRLIGMFREICPQAIMTLAKKKKTKTHLTKASLRSQHSKDYENTCRLVRLSVYFPLLSKDSED